MEYWPRVWNSSGVLSRHRHGHGYMGRIFRQYYVHCQYRQHKEKDHEHHRPDYRPLTSAHRVTLLPLAPTTSWGWCEDYWPEVYRGGGRNIPSRNSGSGHVSL